ncbi:hypothetical protein FRB94_001899 [Tulasnella sp. JGI-2019a]|nr:hypothetical protein FRB93_004046 [Tulasnella sp. JGI-2019a]KAG9005009.1 hypothetical protein FRB94_001899 [Tulasnella sp. JGI-2019a]KAG9031942.1 hypothetical protein FRB95_002078 [Tulasnella sp. JGI-2019a]
MSVSNDQYTIKAEEHNKISPAQKIDDLSSILKATKFAMFTTRDKEGYMHSRAMALSSHEGLHLCFLSDKDSAKQEELDEVDQVNVSFIDTSSTNWVSVCGKAKTHQDREHIKKLWSPATKAWFGDLGDGIHKGDAEDPRIVVIEVIPDSIRYWFTNKTRIGQTVEIVSSAVTGKVASPGELRTITKQEIQAQEQMHRAV